MKKVLIVEDDLTVLGFIAKLVSLQSYEPILAENGLKALNIMKKQRPDLIFMDIEMPVMDGIEATKAIKSDPEFADIPVIAVTAHSILNHQSGENITLFDGYILKPFDIVRFLQVLDSLICSKNVQAV